MDLNEDSPKSESDASDIDLNCLANIDVDRQDPLQPKIVSDQLLQSLKKEEAFGDNSHEKKKKRGSKDYSKAPPLTHFFSVPLNNPIIKSEIKQIQESILKFVGPKFKKSFVKQNADQFHITISMLSLFDDELKNKAAKVFEEIRPKLSDILTQETFNLAFEGVGAFESRPRKDFSKSKHRQHGSRKQEWKKKDSMDDKEGEKQQEYEDKKKQKKTSIDDKGVQDDSKNKGRRGRKDRQNGSGMGEDKNEKDFKHKGNQYNMQNKKESTESENLQEIAQKSNNTDGKKENDVVVNVEEIKEDGSSQKIIIKVHEEAEKEEQKETAPSGLKKPHSKVPSVIFLNLKRTEEISKLDRISHLLISEMLGNQILKKTDLKKLNIHYDAKTNIYKAEQYHVTLFRVRNMDPHDDFDLPNFLNNYQKVALGPFPISRIDLSTRFQSDPDGFYKPLAFINTSQPGQQLIDENNIKK